MRITALRQSALEFFAVVLLLVAMSVEARSSDQTFPRAKTSEEPLVSSDTPTTKQSECEEPGLSSPTQPPASEDFLSGEELDIIVDDLARDIAQRIKTKLSDNIAETLQELEDEEMFQRYLEESAEVERTKLAKRQQELKGCPSSLQELVSGALIDGGDCDELEGWRFCGHTIRDLAEYSDDLGLGCDLPIVFEHGLTLFCNENRPVSEFYDIRCYHRQHYHS